MTLVSAFRLATLILSFPDIALLVTFSLHLWLTATGDYKPASRSEALFYLSAAVLLSAMTWRQIMLLGQPPVENGPIIVILIAEVGILIGMIGQIKNLPRRQW